MTGNWTWIKGASTVDQPGAYGTLGTPDPANTPGARINAVTWTDNSDAPLWLFGGQGYSCENYRTELGDLWRGVPSASNPSPSALLIAY